MIEIKARHEKQMLHDWKQSMLKHSGKRKFERLFNEFGKRMKKQGLEELWWNEQFHDILMGEYEAWYCRRSPYKFDRNDNDERIMKNVIRKYQKQSKEIEEVE